MDTIKLEINFLDRVHVLQPRQISFYCFGKEHRIFALEKEELYASKLVALIDRTKPRDLYDVYYLIKSSLSLDEKLFRLSFLFYLTMDDIFEFPGNLIHRIDFITYKEVRAELKPVLNKHDSFVLSKAQKLVKGFLASFVFNEREMAFLASAKNQIFNFNLLSTDLDFIKKMEQHPMVLWKQKQKKSNKLESL